MRTIDYFDRCHDAVPYRIALIAATMAHGGFVNCSQFRERDDKLAHHLARQWQMGAG